jgi:transposase
MGRPTKLTPEVRQRIVAALRAGNYAKPAAESAGVSEATYYRWLDRGRKQKRGIYREFHDDVRRAEADAEVEAVARWRKAFPDNWRAIATYLERRYPERWRRRESREHTGEGGGPVQISHEEFQDPKVREALRELGKRLSQHRPGS